MPTTALYEREIQAMTMKVKDIPADMTARLPRPGGYITVSLADALEQLEEYFEGRAEGGDGYSELPNKEMHLYSLVKDLQEAFCNGEPNG
jgi:hypothetical protein